MTRMIGILFYGYRERSFIYYTPQCLITFLFKSESLGLSTDVMLGWMGGRHINANRLQQDNIIDIYNVERQQHQTSDSRLKVPFVIDAQASEILSF